MTLFDQFRPVQIMAPWSRNERHAVAPARPSAGLQANIPRCLTSERSLEKRSENTHTPPVGVSWGVLKFGGEPCVSIPGAPCMEYLPTLTPESTPMYVNMSYMECLGLLSTFPRGVGVKHPQSPTPHVPCSRPLEWFETRHSWTLALEVCSLGAVGLKSVCSALRIHASVQTPEEKTQSQTPQRHRASIRFRNAPFTSVQG